MLASVASRASSSFPKMTSPMASEVESAEAKVKNGDEAGRHHEDDDGGGQENGNNKHNNNNNDDNASDDGDTQDKLNLASRIDVLQSTLNQVRQDTESEISRLRDELLDKNRTLEKLQVQLQEQGNYDDMKRQLLKGSPLSPPVSSSLTSPSSPPIPLQPPTVPTPPTDTPTPPPAASPAAMATKGLEMFLLQRAKALQHANPALKALVDLQAASAANKPWFGDMMKTPSLLPPTAFPGGGFNPTSEPDTLATWRRSLERSLLPPFSSPSLVPPCSSPSLAPSPINTPDRATPVSEPKSPTISIPSSVNTTNGNGPDMGGLRFDLKSPFKTEEPLFPLPPSLMHSTASLVSGPRIPKSDPLEGHLQDMLRYNMEKYAGQALDTLGSARRVRELLSVHNIGQRLFAKYVLGLSQGTVSELLSKPKCWEKLTEKGRDSYRKMHAWAYDDNAVMLLKSLIPRKGELSRPSRNLIVPPHLTRTEFPGETDKAKAEAFVPRYPFPGPVGDTMAPKMPFPLMSHLDKKPEAKRPEGISVRKDDLIAEPKQDPIKLPASDPMKEALQRLAFPGLGGFMGKTADEMQRAVELYQSELAKLQQRALQAASGPPPPTSGSVSPPTITLADSAKKDAEPKPSEEAKEQPKVSSSPSDFVQKFGGGAPGVLPPPDFFHPPPHMSLEEKISSSPLQGMASITNSLTNQPIPPPYRPPQRPFKAILPPITQEQFDRYNDINTEEVVRTIKEVLSQYSISQRLFGENVLGLSQGSVSDLLARPKQFHMLTQKGKEPFIRMKLFLEDEQAVHKLVASQYKIAPEKLMRTGNYAGTYPVSAASLSGGLIPGLGGPHGMKFPEGMPPFLRPPVSPPTSSGARFPLLDHMDPFGLQRKLQEQQRLSLSLAAARPGGPNSIYEIAALTQELNTLQLTQKIRETLSANNIGQKMFGEAILGLSQGSVSELLTKPKPWHMLSIKGREPFIRMHLWLNDPHNVEKLQAIKEERDNLKRKRAAEPQLDVNPESPSDLSDHYSSSIGSPGSAKKQRVLFTTKQKEALKIAFNLDPYPSPSAIDFLSQELNLETRSIINWFHNHRMRLKQTHEMDPLVAKPADEQRQFDPLHFRILVNQKVLELEENNPEQAPSPKASHDGLDLSSSGNRSGGVSDAEDDSRQSFGEDAESVSSKSRSRRKPLAPQWVNPASFDDVNGKEDAKKTTTNEEEEDNTKDETVPKSDEQQPGEKSSD